MEFLVSIVSSAVVETGLFLCGCIYPCVKNTTSFQSNLDALRMKMGRLIALQNKRKQELEILEIDGNIRTPQVADWLTEVEGIEGEVNLLQARSITTIDGKFCGNFSSCTLRYRFGTQVAKMLKEVERLLQGGDFSAGMVAVNPLPEPVRHIPEASIEDQTTASNTLAEIMKRLSEDEVRRIGIWGMGGVGKTTLVKNLNNKLKSTSSRQPFGMVIWVTVSKELDLKSVQAQIAERLRLRVSLEESQQGVAIRLYERIMKEKKFILILDDVWETIDLESLGVPQPEIHMGSKIILTSRSLAVCEGMKSDVKVKVDVLNDEEAWQLFIKNAGSEASSEHIRPFAEAVARECSGLPLAIIIMGTAMRGKAKVELWKDALNELRQADPDIKEIKDKVYKPLKWSYDSLHGRNSKPCFLYCSLFPEDYSIKVVELARCWLAEGFIDEQLNYEDSFNGVISIVENLVDLCLLEPGIQEGTVKMHDVVRDVAIWIASSMEDGRKSLVRSGIGLRQISEVEFLKVSKTVSFMNNKIIALPDRVTQCPQASTLLLQGNRLLERVPDQFLLGFQALRVLNISGTDIRSLPLSLTQLVELRALVLRNCSGIKELPPLGGLRKLQVLDLCETQIRELPKGMEELSNLRQLKLSSTRYLKTIQAGVVSKWASLEVLDMKGSGYKWSAKGMVEDGQTTFEELGCLTRLSVVHIWLGRMPFLGKEDLTWIERLRSFQIIVGPLLYFLIDSNKCDGRYLVLSNLDLSQKQIGWLLINASNLLLQRCTRIGWMFEYLVINYESFAGLKSLIIQSCDSLGLFGGCVARHDLLPNLEELHLHGIENLECIWPLVAPLGLRFSRLKLIRVSGCPKLAYLIPHDLIPYLINLEEIRVWDCEKLENLFEYRSGQYVAPDPAVPKLRILAMEDLPELMTICRAIESWKSLEQLEVIHCNKLRRLPLTTQNADTIKEIRGDEWWWSNLQWDDDDAKLSLLPYFRPVGDDSDEDEFDG